MEKEINSLLSLWENRLANPDYDASYKDALNDCIYELRQFAAIELMPLNLEEESWM